MPAEVGLRILSIVKFVRYLFKNLSPVDTVWRLMAGNRGERTAYRVESYIWLKRTKVSESEPECIVSQFNCQVYMGKVFC